MGFRKYIAGIIASILLLAFLPIAFTWVWQKHYMIVTLISISSLWVATIVMLFYQINRIQREVKQFLQSFEYNDSTIRFNKPNVDPSFLDIYQKFDRIIETFSNMKLTKERELLFFKQAAEHTGVGLLAFSETGEIKLINNAFTKLFEVSHKKNITDFTEINPNIFEFIHLSKPGNKTLKLIVNNQLQHIATKIVLFRYENEEFKLIAFHDIKNEIDQTELDAWQKLIRVLRHEIHNSLSPITVLSSGLIHQIENDLEASEVITTNTSKSILEGLKVIRNRSVGLSEFVENYKKLTDLPLPNIQSTPVERLFGQIESLFKNECHKKNISIVVDTVNPNVNLNIDEKLIEQTLINLTSNAIDATKGIVNPIITIEYIDIDDSQTISISDNGHGIPSDLLENIFTPFFTTKKSGSGIGLSLSRQIMRLHNGTLTVNSLPNSKTSFIMKF